MEERGFRHWRKGDEKNGWNKTKRVGFGNPQGEKPHPFPNLDFDETRETKRGRSRYGRETEDLD